jgi:uncharacterized protein (DUF1501 family)
MFSRRFFLKSSALAAFGAGSAPAWLARALYAADAPSPRKKVLVAVFQRGAVDGLNMVVPFVDPEYYKLRPSIAIPKPDSSADSAVDLDGFFGLHPSLAPLKPLYQSERLAIVNAAGSPDPTRSHFDAQDYIESGTPGRKSTPDGWLNRALAPNAGAKSPVRAVSLESSLPRSLRGRNPAVAINSLGDFQVHESNAAGAFENMYASTRDAALGGAGRETFEAVRLIESLRKQAYKPAAQYPNGRFGQSLQQIARLIKANVGLEVAFTEMGGWDTHVNEVGQQPSQGQLANLLREFGQALAAFHGDLGDRIEDVVLVTMSEFGRTARENGTRGTDHGHANVMLVVGGPVKGGSVYGEWPGLAAEQLYEGRDLALTTDFRDVLGELVQRHLGNRDLASVFPGYGSPRFRNLLG